MTFHCLESTSANICLARHHSIRVGFCAFGPVEVDTGISSLGRFDLLVCSNSIPKKNVEAIMECVQLSEQLASCPSLSLEGYQNTLTLAYDRTSEGAGSA